VSWRGDWIWAEHAPRDRHVVALQTLFDLDTAPTSAPARWCAVSRVTLYVNGHEIGRGPVRSNPRTQPADDLDLAPYLVAGRNTVAALVTRYDKATPWYLPPPPSTQVAWGAFLFEAQVGADRWVLSNEDTWTGVVLEGWGADQGVAGAISGRGRETVSAIPLPRDWLTNDVGWPAAIKRDSHNTGESGRRKAPTYPMGPFGGRPLSWPTPVDVALSAHSPGAWRAERVTPGTIVVDVQGPAHRVVTVTAAEFLDASGRPAPNEHDACVAFTLDGTRRTLESFDYYGGRGVIVDAPDDVTVHSVTVRERLHPVEGNGSFECSDATLNQIWAVGRRSVTINSFDAYTDCPTREQRAWTGDSVVHQMVDLTTNFDWSLARRHPRLTAVPRPDGMLPMAVGGDIEAGDWTIIPDWPLHWVHAVWNLYRYVGDRDEIGSLLGVVEGVVRWFVPFCNDDGLPQDVFGWVIIDWSAIYNAGVSAALCGLWGRALLEFAEMATWLGDKGRAAWAKQTHAQLKAGFERLWDKKRKRYVDSYTPESPRAVASQHGQAAAIVGGLAPKRRIPRLVEVITDRANHVHAAFSVDGPADPYTGAGDGPIRVGGAYLNVGHPEKPWWDENRVVAAQPFFRYVVHDALVEAGRADLIVDQCRDWTVALRRCDTSWTECWFGGTVSHGWSSTPTRDLMQRVLGVTPAEPGFTRARIEPNLSDLEWAKGVVPTPFGPITVSIDASGVQVDSPVPYELV
jgi:hypothetical protein